MSSLKEIKTIMSICMDHSDEKLVEICNREFELTSPIRLIDSPPYNSENYKYQIHFIDYLKYMASSNLPGWKLINRIVNKGFIYLNKYDLIRVIAQILMNELGISSKESKSIQITHKIPEYEERSPLLINEEAFPPCITQLLNKAEKGMRLEHQDRLLIANFLNTIQYPVNDIINIFQYQSDFTFQATSYQVLYSRKNKNKPYNCMKVKTFNMCESNSFCMENNLKNPLNYYAKKKFDKSLPIDKKKMKRILHLKYVKKPEEEKNI